MSFSRFFRDRLPAAGIYLAVCLLALIFMKASGSDKQGMIMVGILMLAGGTAILIWDYFRRREFYSRAFAALETADKKYLLSEMVPQPEFADGEALYEMLSEACRDMYENVAEHKRRSSEFREYIELWVHEIKLPVAGMLLMCHNDGDAGERYVSQIRRIDDYIENVLFYARSENAEKDYIIKPVSLQKAFGAVAMKNMDALNERGVSIVTEGLDTEVMTDGKWLEYIMGQLLGNSLKYFQSDREPEIIVSAEVFPERTELRFRDNGAGISASDLPYIFEKSFTGENGRERSRSTGMGLYIVRSLCERLGHKVSAVSEKGSFTEILLTFGRNDHIKMEDS